MIRIRSSAPLFFGLTFPLLAIAVGPALAQGAASSVAQLNVANVGFKTPESVLHDAAADVYLVSNINGVPSGKDNNGFISRVAPDGKVAALKWIEGGQKGVTLNAPKGMAVHGEILYVSDIDSAGELMTAGSRHVDRRCRETRPTCASVGQGFSPALAPLEDA